MQDKFAIPATDLRALKDERYPNWLRRSAQGATQGILYDPEMGQPVNLACSAAGYAWMATKKDEEAMRLVTKQGFGNHDDFGPQAPKTFKSLMTRVHAARKRGFALTTDVFLPAMSSTAAPVCDDAGNVRAMLIVVMVL